MDAIRPVIVVANKPKIQFCKLITTLAYGHTKKGPLLLISQRYNFAS